MQAANFSLARFGVPVESNVISAHRAPEQAHEYAKLAEDRGLEVIIAAAGRAAHLAGVMAANTILPVIGVPIYTEQLGRSEEHTSELQSHLNLVCRLLLEKKKNRACPTTRTQTTAAAADRRECTII